MSSLPTSDPTTELARLQFTLQCAQIGTWTLDIREHQVWWDARCKELYGFAQDDLVPYDQVLSYMHPDDRQRVDQAVQWALDPQSGGYYEVQFRTLGAADGQMRWLLCRGRADFDAQGTAVRFAGTAQDITAQVADQQALLASEARFRSLIEEAPVATSLFVGRKLRVEVANALMLALWGKGPQPLGKPFADILPEIDNQPFLAILDAVYTSGQTYSAHGARADLVVDGVQSTYYFDFTYKPLRNATGQVYAILQMAIDVTKQVLARQQLEDSEHFARTLFADSPVAKAVFMGPDMVIRAANQHMLTLWGKEPSVIGMPFMEAMPELLPTPLLARLQQVLTTGERFFQPEEQFDLLRYGVPYTGYYEYTYEALRSASGTVYGVICVASEVTQRVMARRERHDQEAALRNAVELAELGTFSVDLTTNQLTVSARVAEWFGFDALVADAEAFIGGVGEADRDRVRTSLYHTLSPDSGGRYDVVHSVIHAKTGHQIIIHALGRLYVDRSGAPLKIEGTAQDITAQQDLQLLLKQQVHQRTQELATSNQALLVTNEDLATANQDLLRSNQNLEQFAYIASHDLQEPLRKIQQFGDLLKTRFGSSINGEELTYLERMQVAASRMSVLIKDLLAFSRIATTQAVAQSVSLNEVVHEALESLSVAIEESGAQLEVDALPTVQGDQPQLSQLFQNLLSNALKFRRTSPEGNLVSPRIQIRARLLARTELPALVKPTRLSETYHLIEIIDNGIGFEEKYLDRIFQVFQRLHGKNEFAGTGVGLAIVQKVVTNHGGVVTASGKLNQGATFCVYLPA